jgi:hypothetical protein
MTTEPPLRASNSILGALSLAIASAAVADVSAHRLDELLQAARIDLRDNGVAIDLALTPGADVADSIVAAIDRDRNGLVTSDEQTDYAVSIVGDVVVTIDGARLALCLNDASFPTMAELRSGEGTIRVQVGASHSLFANGPHQLFFSNGHHAGRSVYLANALVPASTRVSVSGQRRTFDQRELTIDYSIGMAQAGFTPGGLLGIVAGMLIVRYTRRYRNRA